MNLLVVAESAMPGYQWEASFPAGAENPAQAGVQCLLDACFRRHDGKAEPLPTAQSFSKKTNEERIITIWMAGRDEY
jgi:hypothetical protein